MQKKSVLLAVAVAILAVIGAVIFLQVHEASHREALAQLTPVARGKALMDDLGCVSCHQPGSAFRAPILLGLYGKQVKLQSGETVAADLAYLRRSILDPRSQVVEGYQNIMPSYRSRLTDDEVLAIIETMK